MYIYTHRKKYTLYKFVRVFKKYVYTHTYIIYIPMCIHTHTQKALKLHSKLRIIGEQ